MVHFFADVEGDWVRDGGRGTRGDDGAGVYRGVSSSRSGVGVGSRGGGGAGSGSDG